MDSQVIPRLADETTARRGAISERRRQPLAFMRGGHLFQIAESPDGGCYIGYRNGRVVSRGAERGEVARYLLASAQDQEIG